MDVDEPEDFRRSSNSMPQGQDDDRHSHAGIDKHKTSSGGGPILDAAGMAAVLKSMDCPTSHLLNGLLLPCPYREPLAVEGLPGKAFADSILALTSQLAPPAATVPKASSTKDQHKQRTTKSGSSSSRTESGVPSTVGGPAPTPSPRHRLTTDSSMLSYCLTNKWTPIIVLPSAQILQQIKCPVESLESFQYFLRNKSLPDKSLPASLPANKFEYLLQIDSAKSINLRCVDSSHVPRFSKVEWYSTIAVFGSGFAWQFSDWPFVDLNHLSKCVKILVCKHQESSNTYQDQLLSEVGCLPHTLLEFKRFGRHFDYMVWQVLHNALVEVLTNPRDFTLFNKAVLE